ncbi:diguanylate cyclase domain-containing protein [Sideroxyarcus sp. TK5]
MHWPPRQAAARQMRTVTQQLISRLLEAASAPVQISDFEVNVSASIGVTLYPDDDADADILMRHADQAMYLAKQAGKNCYRLFYVGR